MNTLNIIRHFKKICTHKRWVFHYCKIAGITWQGIIHDLSKFSPTEFCESVKYYQGTRSPIDACKEKNGWSAAWMHHKGRNKHHYEYWQDDFDHGGKALEMPYKYKVEMLCDFLGAGRAYYGKDFTYQKELDWWINKSTNNPIAMHPKDKAFIDKWLRILVKNGDRALKSIYKRHRH